MRKGLEGVLRAVVNLVTSHFKLRESGTTITNEERIMRVKKSRLLVDAWPGQWRCTTECGHDHIVVSKDAPTSIECTQCAGTGTPRSPYLCDKCGSQEAWP